SEGATLGVRLPNWLRDALLARRALDSPAAAHGEEHLVLAIPPAFATLLAGDHPHARWLRAGHGPGDAWTLGQAWKNAGVKRVVLFPNSLSSRIAGLVSGARERIGFGGDAEADLGLTRRVPRRPRGERH